MIEKGRCTGCSACYSICPVKAISMEQDKEGFLYPIVDKVKCINCSLCEQICPIEKYENKKGKYKQEIYAAYANNEEIRYTSSSGGIFSLLGHEVINQEGIVVGCAMTEDCRKAIHITGETKKALLQFRGSKYLQSDLLNTFEKIKRELEKGRQVLFSGTPCQVGGLKAYLKYQEYSNLLLIDFICHGVASPLVWNNYVLYREKIAKDKTKSVYFRNKSSGWKLFSLLFKFADNGEYQELLTKDPYMRGFLNNLYLRPSCYQCKFKGDNYYSDITLADFWGIDSILPELNDDKGISLVVIHTEKGKNFFDNIASDSYQQKVDTNKALMCNPSYYYSVPVNGLRKKFFNEVGKEDFEKIIEKYCGQGLIAKSRRKLDKLITIIFRNRR